MECVTVAKTHLHLIITVVNAIMLVIFVSTIRDHFLSIKFKNASETLSPITSRGERSQIPKKIIIFIL